MSAVASNTASSATISLEDVSISFPLYHGGSRSLKKSLLFRGSGGRIGTDSSHRIIVEALRNISLSLNVGDRLALIGPNGAGKTTLLRVMAGIYEPTAGKVTMRGRISPMFDISLGIDHELTGYDNIRLRGLILGMAPGEIEEKLPGIAEFTGLNDYLEMPVRTYSAGMMLRLTFAVATCFEPEVLLMDEWIVAGDAGFMTQARQRIAKFIDKAAVMVLASHDLQICQQWCNKAVWLDQGQIMQVGDVEEVANAYYAAATAV
jgi:ABC-2 type transport system ATP-binding protein/lipopolysaccharide transport system ATP-binding protein